MINLLEKDIRKLIHVFNGMTLSSGSSLWVIKITENENSRSNKFLLGSDVFIIGNFNRIVISDDIKDGTYSISFNEKRKSNGVRFRMKEEDYVHLNRELNLIKLKLV